MESLLERIWAAMCAPFLRLWQRPWVQGIARRTQRVVRFLTEPVLGGLMDRYTADDAPPFRRFRAWLGYRFGLLMRREQRTKITVSAALVLLAAVCGVCKSTTPMWLACAGMGFSFFGDAMLMQYPPIRNLVRQYFLWGMGCFAAAQICYLRALWMIYAQRSDGQLWPLALMIALYALFALLQLGRCILFREQQPALLRALATLYGLLVASMAGAAAAVCFATAGRAWLLLVGGLLFFISDLLIALTDFGGMKLPRKEAWIWGTYVPAQLCILLSTAVFA